MRKSRSKKTRDERREKIRRVAAVGGSAPGPVFFDWLIVFAILAVTFSVYAQTRGFDFVNYDDPEYVTGNPHVRAGLTAVGIAWAFTSTEAANWFPLTRLSHIVDYQLFGPEAGWHHLVNVLLHGVAAVLLFAFLRRATGARWPSAFVAFVFALHPLHVESVAWIAERKDVLSAVFWFLALWAYVGYAERPSAVRYALVAAAFCGGLMAKPMIVTLPILLLLLDVWPLRRKASLKEKIPLFALAGAAAVWTFVVQRGSGAVRPFALMPAGLRVENAIISYVLYMARTVWPVRLAVFYPYPVEIPAWQWVAAGLALAGATILVLRWFRGLPFLAVGWFWFLITLAPVIGLVQVGSQARADRYMYVPMIGLLIMAAWGVQTLVERRPRFTTAAAAIAVLACCACVPAAAEQIGYWRNSETLFWRALAVTADNSVAEHNLGSALLDKPAKLTEATAHLERAVQLDPNSVRAHTDLGSALAKIGRLPEAIAEYRVALRFDPEAAITEHNLENALSDLAETHYSRGLDLAKVPGHAGEAIAEMQEALRLRPDYPEAHNNLGVLLAQMPRRSAEALAHFEEAVLLRPDYVEARYNLAVALADGGRRAEAIAQLEAALRVRQDPAIRAALEKLQGR